MNIRKVILDHMDDVAAFGGGAGMSIFGWLHIEPGVIVGKLLATFVLGVVGGVSGITAKWICNRFFKWLKKIQNGKPS